MQRSLHAAAGRRSFIQDALGLMGNRFATTGLSLLTGVVLARSLGPEGRGLIAAALVYPGIFISLTEMGVRQSAIFYLGKHICTDRQVVGAVSSLLLLTASVGLCVTTGAMLATGNESLTPTIIALAVASIPLALVKNYSAGIFLGKRLVGQFTRISRMAETQRLLMVSVLVWWLGFGVPGALIATLLSSLVVAGYAIWRIRAIASIRPSWHWASMRLLLFKGAGYAVALFMLTFNQQVDIALMERLSSSVEIGVYTVALAVAHLTWMMPQSITTALFSHGASAKDAAVFSYKVAKLFRVTVVGSVMLVVALAVAAPLLIPFVYGSEFSASVWPLWLLLPGVFCLLALKILNMDLAGRGRPLISLCVTVPGVCVNVALNVYLLPKYGACGAATASSIAYCLEGLAFMLVYCRVTGLRVAELWRYQRSDFDFLVRASRMWRRPLGRRRAGSGADDVEERDSGMGN